MAEGSGKPSPEKCEEKLVVKTQEISFWGACKTTEIRSIGRLLLPFTSPLCWNPEETLHGLHALLSATEYPEYRAGRA